MHTEHGKRTGRCRDGWMSFLTLFILLDASSEYAVALKLPVPKLARWAADGLLAAVQTSQLPQCIFKCQTGFPVRKETHAPGANGCGVKGLPLELSPNVKIQSAMERCCNAHDRCYDHCNADKHACDASLHVCMHRACRSQFNGSQECHDVAHAYSTGVAAIGCIAYKAAQARSCYCSHDVKNQPPRRKHMYSAVLPLLELDARSIRHELHALYLNFNPLRWLALDLRSDRLRYKIAHVHWYASLPKSCKRSNSTTCLLPTRKYNVLSQGGALGDVHTSIGSGCIVWLGGDNAVLDLGCKNIRHVQLSWSPDARGKC